MQLLVVLPCPGACAPSTKIRTPSGRNLLAILLMGRTVADGLVM